jgi:hypothetical protein
MADDLKFLSDGQPLPFRVVKRKGELRYIASNSRGSLGAMTRFAPPTKALPKLVFRLASLIDFRIPRLAEPLQLSKFFLEQVASCLAIPVERVGIYVGEPNERRKLVIIDTAGGSKWVLKMAVGAQADEAIRRERGALQKAVSGEVLAVSCQSGAEDRKLSVPLVREIEPVCGHESILIERVSGKQLSPKEFETAFFAEGTRHWALGIRNESGCWVSGAGEKQRETEFALSIGQWVNDLNLDPGAQNLVPLLAACRECGALDLRSPLGVVHGDFAPWNIIRREANNNDQSRYCAIDWEFSRADTPLIFDIAYACWCYSELLGRMGSSIDSMLWKQLVALGALWMEIRENVGSSGVQE